MSSPCPGGLACECSAAEATAKMLEEVNAPAAREQATPSNDEPIERQIAFAVADLTYAGKQLTPGHINALVPYVMRVVAPALAAREAEVRREVAEEAIAAVERNYSTRAASCACPAEDRRDCGWRAGVGAAADAVRKALRVPPRPRDAS